MNPFYFSSLTTILNSTSWTWDIFTKLILFLSRPSFNIINSASFISCSILYIISSIVCGVSSDTPLSSCLSLPITLGPAPHNIFSINTFILFFLLGFD
ncbi:unnamed protein product [Bacillus phage SPP1]|uniref:Bacteriophage SPP1 complete nucleotide sequence n=1 Tax=Bacillus phage SPP1 TaxID=10724 RepID=O48491_BPSPP|nr:hypothetical protein SPP1p073 [Bacillus phage SPP1]CAA66542.1 unnamed protein product [Bacillus phage SPP1]